MAAPPATRPARSGSGPDDGRSRERLDPAADDPADAPPAPLPVPRETSATGSPDAIRSAVLPVRPAPSDGRGVRKSGAAGERYPGASARWTPMAGSARSPTAAGRPSPAEDCGGAWTRSADRADVSPATIPRRTRRRGRRRRPSAPARPARRLVTRHGSEPLRAAPRPGTSGRPGRRSTGSRPPGARRPAAPADPPRSTDGDGRDGRRGHPGRPRRRRMGTPARRPSWAIRDRSSRR